MAYPEHLKIIKQGAEAWNEWREENPDIKPNLIKADFIDADLIGADLNAANLSGANLIGADLFEADLREADLRLANLRLADLREANLSEANFLMANLSGANLIGANLIGANLSGANLGGANLSGADLIGANLIGANLFEADLFEADLSEANFLMADLNAANLNGANLSWADLNAADLTTANLTGANLTGANLTGANLSDSGFGYTIFGNIDLSNVSGLESTEHFGPSTIGLDTIFRSAGKIPHKFLEDAGVPDVFINYMGSLTRQAFQFYSCFISYSTDDKDFADRIYADLRKEGVRCWFAPEDIQGGKKIHRQLDEAIRIHDKILLILSEKSIKSDWVANEIKWARKREKQESKQKLFPVTLIEYKKLKHWELFDADTATDLAAEVRSYFIPDFTNWKDHDDYSVAFKRLLRDLKKEE